MVVMTLVSSFPSGVWMRVPGFVDLRYVLFRQGLVLGDNKELGSLACISSHHCFLCNAQVRKSDMEFVRVDPTAEV